MVKDKYSDDSLGRIDRNPIQTNEMNASGSFSEEENKFAVQAASIAKKSR